MLPDKPNAVDDGEIRDETMKAEIYHIDRILLAQKAEDEEHKASIIDTLAKNHKILILCAFANIGPLMYGFDNLATSLCLSMPAFQ